MNHERDEEIELNEEFLSDLEKLLDKYEDMNSVEVVVQLLSMAYSIMQDAVMGTFLVMPNGDIKVTNPEGYVAFDQDQNGVKFIDRLEFSRANFILPKNWIKPTETQPIE